MVNIGLIIIAVIMLGLLGVANFFLIVHFSSVEDKNTAWFPKIVTLLGLTLTQANVLLLPMDVANARTNGGIPMEEIWLAFYIMIAILGVIVIPFTIFYYESEDPDKTSKHQVISAIKYGIIFLVIFVVLSVILYLPLGYAEIPIYRIEASNLVEISDPATFRCTSGCTEIRNAQITYPVTYPLYIISLLTFIGMIFLTLFGGIGFAALPIDLLNGFRLRPKRIPFRIYAEEKVKIGLRSERLLEKGKKLKEKLNLTGGRAKGRRDRARYNEFRTEVFLLEEDYTRLKKAYGEEGKGPLIAGIIWGWMQLPLAILAIIITLSWLIHLFLYMMTFPPLYPFLNNFFVALDRVWGLFGTIAYGCFSFYLLWCVMKGNFKFGLQIPFIFKIHPIKVNGTLMSSFLFNTALLLFSSVTVVQFCADAFSIYNRNTGVDVIFNVGIRNLRGLKYLFRYYQWVILGLAVVSAVVLLLLVKRRKKQMKYQQLKV